MFKKFISGSAILSLALFMNPVWGMPDFATYTVETHGIQKTLMLPAVADQAPVISLGTAVDPATGAEVEGYAIIHYDTSAASSRASARAGAPKCYTYLVKNTKWRTVEPWIVNPANASGLAGDFVFGNLALDISKWEDATDGLVGNGVGVNVLGDGMTTAETLAADTVAPDNKNEVYFADVSTSGAIAVTIVWYNRFTRSLVEWDQVYDDVDYDWSASGEVGKMDLENIATHELGHSVGMGDLYTTSCAEETMYGYADYGEIKKRDLNTGDINGINALY